MHIFVAVKYGLLFILLYLSCMFASAQNTPVSTGGYDAMRLVSSSRGVIMDQKVIRHYNPVYEHKGNTLKADSGDFRRDDLGREFFEAYGNIVITQPSGTIIYGDRLHYEAAVQHAILTNNVRVLDGQSVLTTNYLTYNFRDQRGTYTGGGRILSGQDTITSQNAYYFERTKDSYFRNKVVVRSTEVVVYTDTMRYNSISRDNFFYGPTNIEGRDGENLYTERGVYNTGTGIAKFNKNNLFTETSKFLKGDSLYYDRSNGYGEAFRNVVFVDTVDKWYGNSGYGKYIGGDESITLADKPLVKMAVSNDTTANVSDSTDSTGVVVEKEEKLSRKERRQREREEELQLAEVQLDTELDTISNNKETDSLGMILPPPVETPVDTVYMTADTVFSRMIPAGEYLALDLKLDREGGQIEDDNDVDYGEEDGIPAEIDGIADDMAEDVSDDLNLDQDSLSVILLDSIGKIAPIKEILTEKIAPPRLSKVENLSVQQMLQADSTLRQQAVVPGDNEAERLINQAMEVAMQKDTTAQDTTLAGLDTARTRIVKAYYNVRLFKSDLQAVADSVYYGMQDSMFRFMGRPMIWTEGSQISADTIFMQMVNQKLDNALLKNNGLIVNAVLDSVKFNQLKGRRITVFFENNSMERVFVDGNAENLSFNADENLKIIKEMFHDKSARIAIRFRNKEVYRYRSIRSVNQQLYPLKMVNQENEILPGFIWRPQDRPRSQEDMMDRIRDLGTTEAADSDVEEGKKKEETPLKMDEVSEAEEIQEIEQSSVEVEEPILPDFTS